MLTARKAAAIAAAAFMAFALVVVAPTASSAVPPNDTMLTMAWESGELYSVDPSTGATTEIGGGSLISSTGIAWDQANGVLYGIDYDFEPASLYTVDPDTGAATVVGSLGLNEPTGLDVQPGTSDLFMVYDMVDGDGSILATVDPSTAAVSDIGPTTDGQTSVRLSSIAFDPGDSTLYGRSYQNGLYSIDPSTGALTLLFSDVDGGYGLAFDCDGNLFSADDNELYSIDLTDGSSSDIGPMDFGDDFTENLTVICGVTPPETTTTIAPTTTAPAPVPTVAPAARAVAAAPRFTG